MTRSVIDIDGSLGEGGGQILRSSLALSLLTGKAFRLRNIRARRPKPGLQPQHLKSVLAAAEIGQANVRGASLHSSELFFEPGSVSSGDYRFAIGTAGATGLVLHTVYLPLALAGKRSSLTLEGGTHVSTSPCYHFLSHTWRRYLAALGLDVRLDMKRPGFYPRGGGCVQVEIESVERIKGFTGPKHKVITRAAVISAVASLPEHVAKRQAARAIERLAAVGVEASVREVNWVNGPGTMLGIELPTEPVPTFFFALGARGKRAEAVADEAVDQVETFLAADPPGIDAHSADQIVLPLAFAEEPSEFRTARVTQHLLTNVGVIARFLPRKIVCDGAEGEPGLVRVLS